MRILMLGNSLTTANDMPGLLGGLSGGEVVVHARGGARLAEHLNPATRLGAATQEALTEGDWDFLVLQEMSHAPATAPAAYLRSVERLCAQACARGITPVLYGTWAYAPDCPKLARLGMEHARMHELMQGAYAQAVKLGGALLANVGAAFEGSADLTALYSSDGVHPSMQGSRLAAEVIAGSLMR